MRPAPSAARPAAIDLRSDTVTLPPPGMREAMARAEVGDDVYGEDPTVNRLESLASRLVGKEAALFVPSGTMANLLALLAHCPRGRKVLLGDQSDIWLWEAGGGSALGGLVHQPVPTAASGELALADLEAAIGDGEDPQCAIAGLVCLEDTHCMTGGRVLSLDYLQTVGTLTRQRDLPLHLDGARIFNAAVALGVDVCQIARSADSVTFCLSKGLAAPVGSILLGTEEFVGRARRLRKMLGGGMRQAGFLAAAGIFALGEMVGRLAEDHALARLLADGLSRLPGIELRGLPQTNIVIWTVADPAITERSFITALAQEGVRVAELGKGRIRAVTHYGIGREEIERAVDAAARAVARCRAVPRRQGGGDRQGSHAHGGPAFGP
jgi:threonine aldolase